jgi:hypothetical protein
MSNHERHVLSSRLHRAGSTSIWSPSDGIELPMPVVFDLRLIDTETGEDVFRFDATIDLVEGTPVMVRFVATAAEGLDLVRLQREFRWATPVDVVTRLVPSIISSGGDPFDYDYPVEGFPEVVDASRSPANLALSDAFLEGIAREYLDIGRGYAKKIAIARGVSPRTVVSWIEKARQRGILTTLGAGSYGGEIVPPDRRQPER